MQQGQTLLSGTVGGSSSRNHPPFPSAEGGPWGVKSGGFSLAFAQLVEIVRRKPNFFHKLGLLLLEFSLLLQQPPSLPLKGEGGTAQP